MSYVICNGCGGKGKILEMGEEPCWACVGTGLDSKSSVLHRYCGYCGGSGMKPYCRHNPCRQCYGTGKLYW